MHTMFLFEVLLMPLFCRMDDVLQNHENMTPYQIVESIEGILKHPEHPAIKNDPVKRLQYLYLYKKNLEIVYPLNSHPEKWFTHYEIFLIFIKEQRYEKCRDSALWYAEKLKNLNNDNFFSKMFLLNVYLDLSLTGALLDDKNFMEKYMLESKKYFAEITKGESLSGKYDCESVIFQLQFWIYEREVINCSKLNEWDRAFSVFSEYEKIYGTDFCKKYDQRGYRDSFLFDYYENKGDLAKAEYHALENIKIARKNNSYHLRAYIFASERCFERKEYKQALDYCNYVLNHPEFKNQKFTRDKKGNRTKLYLITADCYAALGEKEKCLKYLNMAQEKSKDPEILKRIQTIREKTGMADHK